MKWGKSIGPISTFISDENSQQSSTGTPVLLRVTGVAFFFPPHKLKTKPYTRKKFRTCFVAVFAFSRWSGTGPAVSLRCACKREVL